MNTKVINCSICGRNAWYNTPMAAIGMDGTMEGGVMCSGCQKAPGPYPDLLYTEVERTEDGLAFSDEKSGTSYWYRYRDIIIQLDALGGHAWHSYGNRAWPLFDSENKLCTYLFGDPYVERRANVFRLLRSFSNLRALKLYRCTSCRKTFHEEDGIGGYPLFAGMVCPSCWTKHQAHLELERKSGQVCSMCHQPYSACCC